MKVNLKLDIFVKLIIKCWFLTGKKCNWKLINCTGNDYLAEMTSRERTTLRVEVTDWNCQTRYAEYNDFQILPAAYNYRLQSLGSYSGDAGSLCNNRPITYLQKFWVVFYHIELRYYMNIKSSTLDGFRSGWNLRCLVSKLPLVLRRNSHTGRSLTN